MKRKPGAEMRVVTTAELKSKTTQVLKSVIKGGPIIITYRGKPAAAINPLTEDDLVDLVLENSPRVRKMIAEAKKDLKEGKTVALDAIQGVTE
jgi:prevent-host-death family protein